MIGPWLLPLAALFTAGGIGANAIGARQQDKARAAAMARGRERVQPIQQENEALSDRSRERYEGFDDQMADRARSLADLYRADGNNPTAMLPTASSNIVMDNDERERGEGRAFSNQQGQARLNLRSFGDVLGDRLRMGARDAGRMGVNQGMIRGYDSLLPMEMEAANARGGGARLLGSVLSGLGQIGMTAGLANPANLPSFLGGGAGSAAGAGATMGGPANINSFGTSASFFRPGG